MDIRSAHDYLATLLASLTITEPVAAQIKRSWKFIPPANYAIQRADLPCTFSSYELKGVVFGPAILKRQYSLHIQLLTGQAEMQGDIASDIASAFGESLIQALIQHQRMNGTVSVINDLRGASPDTLTALSWAGESFIGLDLYLDVLLTDVINNAAA